MTDISHPQEEKKSNDVEQIFTMLGKQQSQLDEISAQNKKILRHFFWMSVGSYLKILLIAVPLILALIYLPPLLDQVYTQYQDLIGTSAKVKNFDLKNIDIQKLLGQ